MKTFDYIGRAMFGSAPAPARETQPAAPATPDREELLLRNAKLADERRGFSLSGLSFEQFQTKLRQLRAREH